MKQALRKLVLVGLVSCSLGCANSRVVSHVGRDDTARITSGLTSVGSRNVHPAGWHERPDEERLIADPTEEYWPELPVELIRRIETYMTEADLIELLGDPMTKEVSLQDIDSDFSDWNANVFTWKYQDSRITTGEMTRDLEVRLGYVYTGRTLPPRDDIMGPAWVVIGWDLF